MLCRFLYVVKNKNSKTTLSPVGWGCRIHHLPLYRGVRLPPMNVQDMTLNNLMVKYLFIANTPRSILARSGST